MKSIIKILVALTLVLMMIFNMFACATPTKDPKPQTNTPEDISQSDEKDEFHIEGSSNITIVEGQTVTLKPIIPEGMDGEIIWTSSNSCVSVENGIVTALKEGTSVVKAILNDEFDVVVVNVAPKAEEDTTPPDDNEEEDYVFGSEYPCITVAEARAIAEDFTSSASNEIYYIVATVSDMIYLKDGEMTISDETGSIYVYRSTDVNGASLNGSELSNGDVLLISGTLRNYKGTLEIEHGKVIAFYDPETEQPPKPDQGGSGDNKPDTPGGGDGEDIIIPGTGDPVQSDPYIGVNVTEFYKNYTPAISYNDAYYRTKHNLLSGTLADQDQAPTISSYQPKNGNTFIRNNVYFFSEDGNTYYVVDCYGEIAFEVYKGGAYITLEEVAAYVFAFGEPPANQTSSKNTKPTSSGWGKYLRLNNTKFSGDTSKYPYEPVLPRISGCGGDLTYYEMDIGTTGTDCDPKYDAAPYNNGNYITRGAARIVYSCYDRNGNKIIDLDERYVFYTYNHYNDFQEYLNYYGGWGEMFGNITGGGTISSKYDYNPTDYVPVYHGAIGVSATRIIVYAYFPKEEYAA